MFERYLTSLASIVFLLLVTPFSASAQLELGQGGNVAVGAAPYAGYKLRVQTDGSGTQANILSGVRASAEDAATRNVGVHGYARGGGEAFGVRGAVTPPQGGIGYGVYGTLQGGGNYAGYFNGNVHITGSLSGLSDRRFKRDIQSLGDDLEGKIALKLRDNARGRKVSTSMSLGRSAAREKLLQLKPMQYQYKREEYEQVGLPKGKQFGLIAQEVENIFPALVSTEVHPGREIRNDEGEIIGVGESTTFKSVNYMQLIPLLLQTVQEQQAEIDALREEVAAIKRQNRSH